MLDEVLAMMETAHRTGCKNMKIIDLIKVMGNFYQILCICLSKLRRRISTVVTGNLDSKAV